MASISWKSGVSGNWTSSSLWSPASVPGSADIATIGAAGTYTVSMSVSTAVNSVTLNAAGATMNVTNTLTLGNSLEIDAGTFILSGTINGGTMALRGGAFTVTAGSTLNGVTYLGTMNIGAGAELVANGSLTMGALSGSGAGTINLTGAGGLLAFNGNQTFSNALINFGSTSQSNSATLFERDSPGTGATLTLGPSVSVVGNGGYGLLRAVDTAGNDGLVTAGTVGFGSSGGLIEVSANRYTNTGSMAVTSGATLDLLTGIYGVPSGEVGTNSGTISMSSGVLAFGSTFTNTGAILVSGGTLTIGGRFVTTGTFTVNNARVSVGGTVTGASILALLSNTSDVVTYTAVYNNSGSVLNVGSGTALGTLSLTSSLPIQNGTIADAGGGFLFNGGTLTSVTYQGTLGMTAGAGNLNIAGSLISQKTGGGGPGTIALSGTSALLSFLNSQTLNSATVLMGSSNFSKVVTLQERDVSGTGTTLTLGSSLQVVSNGGAGVIQSVGTITPDSLVNLGTIQAASGRIEVLSDNFTNQGSMAVSGTGTLEILTGERAPPADASGVNAGTVTQTGGLLMIGGTLTNTGSIISSGGTVKFSGTFIDQGTLQVNNATVNLGGTFTGASFLQMMNNASDTVNVAGVYNNAGQTLDIGAGTAIGTVSLVSGLTLAGGTVVDHGGGLIGNDGTLDGVTYVGAMVLGASASVNVIDGLVVKTSGGASPGTINVTGGYSSLSLLNTETVDNVVVNIGDSSGATDSLFNNATGTATLGAHVLVKETTGNGQIYDYAGATTVNQGTLSVTGGELDVYGDGGAFTNAGTISVGNGAVFAATAFLGTSSFANTGLIAVSGGATVDLEAGWSNSGSISVNGATLQLGNDSTTPWANTGTISGTNATLELEGAFTTAQFNQLRLSSGDTTNIIGAMNNGSATLNVTSSLGAVVLDGGTITGGTIVDAQGGLDISYGVFDGVTYDGTLDVGFEGAVDVVDGFSLLGASGSGNGTLDLNNGGSGIITDDTETFDHATVNIGDASGETDYIENFAASGAGTLTFGANLLIQQSAGDAAIYTGDGDTTVNNGRITVTGGTFHVDGGSVVNAGTISLSGSSTEFNANTPDFTNTGLLKATSGAAIGLQAGWDNTGTISVNGGELQLGSDTVTAWGTIGTITATASTLDLYGTFTASQLASLQLSSDTVDIEGVLNNAGATLSIGTGTAITAFAPESGGLVVGGTIVDAGGGLDANGGTLQGVTYTGTMALGGGTLNVSGGLTLKGSGGGAGAMMLTGGGASLAVLDSETIDNATITVGDASNVLDILNNAGDTLTLGAHVLLQQSTGQGEILTGSGNLTVDNGTIAVSGGTLTVTGGTFTEGGTMTVAGGAEVLFKSGVFSNASNATLSGGVYAVGAGSTMELASSITTLSADLTLSGAGSLLQSPNGSGGQTLLDTTLRTVTSGAALRLLAGRSMADSGALQDQGLIQLGGGTLSSSGTLAVTVTGSLVGFGTILGYLTDNGVIEANGGALVVQSSPTGTGQFLVDSGATLEFASSAAVSTSFNGAGGILQLDRPTSYTGAINNIAVGDSIVLQGVTASSASISGSTLTVNLTSGKALTYTVSGNFASFALQVSTSGGNSTIAAVAAAPTTITSVYNNAGNTLYVGGSHPTLTLAGGTIVGGKVIDYGTGLIIGNGTLQGVNYGGTVVVGAAGTLNVTGGITLQGTSGGTGAMTLTGGGSTVSVLDSETLDNATISIGDASGSLDILGNSSGTLTLGAHLLLQQSVGQGELLAASGATIVDNGGIAVSGGTLSIAGGTFTEGGTITVTGGGEVAFLSGTFSNQNLTTSTLTGGVYVVGASSTLELTKSITTLAADLTLNGTGSSVQSPNGSGQTLFDSSIRTIASGGALRLLGGRSLKGAGTLNDQGVLQLAGGSLSTSGTIVVSNSLVGFGTISGYLTDNGMIEASGGDLIVQSSPTGTGAFEVDAGATLEFASSNKVSSSFNGTGGVLLLDHPTSYTGAINNFAVGDSVVLTGTTASSASISGTTMTVNLTSGKTLTYTVSGNFAGLAVQTTVSGGNSTLTLASTGSGSKAAVAQISPVEPGARTGQLRQQRADPDDRAGRGHYQCRVSGPDQGGSRRHAGKRRPDDGDEGHVGGDCLPDPGLRRDAARSLADASRRVRRGEHAANPRLARSLTFGRMETPVSILPAHKLAGSLPACQHTPPAAQSRTCLGEAPFDALSRHTCSVRAAAHIRWRLRGAAQDGPPLAMGHRLGRGGHRQARRDVHRRRRQMDRDVDRGAHGQHHRQAPRRRGVRQCAARGAVEGAGDRRVGRHRHDRQPRPHRRRPKAGTRWSRRSWSR